MDFVSKTPINKGWSSDKKYCVTDKNGMKYLLRVSDAAFYNAKKFEFDMMKKVASFGIPMCRPLSLDIRADGVYFLQSWIDGVDAGDVIGNMPSEQQYALGVEAGRLLKIIHSIPAPAEREDWEPFYNRKLDKKITSYNNCPYKYESGNQFIDYINANRHLLKGRPQVYQHGDFHRGNLMLGVDNKLYVIDFGRNDHGDPWEDLKSTTWDVELSPIFAVGKIDGYFNNNIPDVFWRTLKLYIYCGILSSASWAIAFGEDEVQVMRNQAAEVLKWYDDNEKYIPNWYLQGNK